MTIINSHSLNIPVAVVVDSKNDIRLIVILFVAIVILMIVYRSLYIHMYVFVHIYVIANICLASHTHTLNSS